MRRGLFRLVCLGWLLVLAVSAARADLLTPDERAWLTAHGPLRYAPDPRFAPFEFFREDGRLAGISPEILEQVAHNLGTTILPVRYVSWTEALTGFQRGDADFLATLTRTPEREKFIDFTAPYLSVPNVLIVNSAAHDLKGFDDLAGRTVAVVRNSGAHSWLLRNHPEVIIRPQANAAEGLRKVSVGQLDAMLEVLPVAGFAIAEESYMNLRVLPEVQFTIPQHLGVHKGDARLRAILEKGLASVPVEERLRIFSRWTGEDPARRGSVIPHWISRAAAVLVLLVLGFAAWTYALRREVGRRVQALRVSEAQFRQLLEELPIAAGWADAAGRMEFVNREFVRRFGYTCEELGTLEHWFELAYPDEAYRRDVMARRDAAVAAAQAKGGATAPLDVSLTCKDGQVRNVIVVGCLVGEKALAVFEDVTERVRMEQQLRQAQKMEAVGQLAGGVAHDFNNLLTVIQGHSSMVLGSQTLPDELRESVEQIQQAGERAANLTRQLLTFSRQQAFRPEPLDLRASLESIGRMLRRLLGEQVTLALATDGAPVCVLADGGMIEQVIVNLAVNARDAMPGGGRLEIGVKNITVPPAEAGVRHAAATAGRFALLTVHDTGTGLSPEALNHLFEPFFTTKAVGRGTGLGLATVYGIVQLHRGWIEVASAPGAGTTFSVFIPASDDAVEPAGTAAGPDALPGGSETILVVEDEAAVRLLVRTSLRRAGYQVFEAEDASAALRVWDERAGRIDLLLSDMVMPGGMSGAELAQRLRQQNPALKVIVASGYSRRTDTSDPFGAGVEHLPKPFDVTTLARAVRRVLDGQRPPAER